MKKVIMGFIAAAVIMPSAFAGSIDYLSNQSADYIRTFSRNAAEDYADAAFYNPAGTAFMKDGLSLQLNNQTILKYYSDTYNGKKYETDLPTLSLPSFWGVYKKESMSGYIGFSAIGGGGQVDYKDGIPLMAQMAPAPTTFTDGKLYVNQLYPSMTLGGSYAFNTSVSVSLGARAVYMIRKYTGEATYSVGATPVATQRLDAQETAFGVGGIVGVDIRPIEKLNVALRFETPVILDAKTKVDNGKSFGLFKDGSKRRKDLPAVIAAGIGYTIGGLTLTTSTDVFCIGWSDQGTDSAAKGLYNNGYDDDFDNFGYEVSASAEYAIIPNFLKASVGYMYNKVGGNDKTYTDFDFSLDSQSVGTGVKLAFADNIEGTLALGRIFYADGKNASKTVTYKKAAYTVALGLDYRFN
jgi:long-chain fatty acid transport protein